MKAIVYLKAGCPWALAVTRLLTQRQIPFEERDIIANKEFAREVEAKSGQSKSPTLDIDGEIIPDAGVEDVEEYLGRVATKR